MIVRRAVAVGSLTLVAGVGLAAPAAASAAAVCDAYSGTCTEPPPPTETSVRSSPVPSTNPPATLPFTGGELVLVSALGAGAVAAGTMLVVAGRRRAGAPTA